MRQIILVILVLFWVSITSAAPVQIDPRRSLAVTEQAILAHFPLERVLTQLAEQSQVPGTTALSLFHQLWDTQNPDPGLGLGPHCNDQVNKNGRPALNSFPYTCRRSEGRQAQTDPFANSQSPNAYIPVGLFNRFDLAPKDGANCGEYRIAFAKRSGILNQIQRAFLIFEAVLPNPNPGQGLQGCLPIARFWSGLSQTALVEERAARLEDFYFNGIPGVQPVVQVDHYGGNPQGTGQVRANLFMNIPRFTGQWMLREFKLIRAGSGVFVPQPDENNPPGALFEPDSTHPKAAAFRAFFPSQVANLAAERLTDITMQMPDEFSSGQSISSLSNENDLSEHFDDGELKMAIQVELNRLGSGLTPEQIVERAQAMVCAGCHQLSNNRALGGGLRWPSSRIFTHTSEQTEVVNGQRRHRLSQAITQVFLPQREKILEDFLNGQLRTQQLKPHEPLSGFRTH